MQTINLSVNGEKVNAAAEPRMHLADFLRESRRLTGTHLGCEHGVCGACTVLIDGAPVRSCITFAVACEDREVRTIEGFDDDPVMNQLRAAFNQHHGLQCGFCTPGMLIAARDLVLRVPDADEKKIRVEMSGNLCRCTGYMGIVQAIRSVIDDRRGGAAASRSASVPPLPRSFTPFEPDPSSASNASIPAPDDVPAKSTAPLGKGATQIEDEFQVRHPVERVWEMFADMPAVAACLPGAEITEHFANSVKGKITVRFGPMQASFSGAASLERDAAAKRGSIRGAGVDNLSGSRARGDISYQLFDAGAGGTRVAVKIEYTLQGPLAQFSRGSLVREFVKRMVNDFALNLETRLAGGASQLTPPVASLDAGHFLWRWVQSRIRAILKRKG